MEVPTTNALNLQNIIEQLTAAHHYLLGSTSRNDRKAYQECKTSTQEHVYAYLETAHKRSESESIEGSRTRTRLARAIDLFNAAAVVYDFFFPSIFPNDAPTVGKFWGAIEVLVEVRHTHQDPMRRRTNDVELGFSGRHRSRGS